MPEEPGRDRLAAARLKRRRSGRPRRRFREKDPIPWDADVIEPHLCIEFVEAAAQGRDKWILVTDRHLAADHGDARRRHRDDECDPMRTARHRTDCAYVDILCEGHSGMHANLAAHHDAGVRLFDQTHRSSLVGVLAHPVPDRCCTPGESEEATSVSYPVPILCCRLDMLR